MPPCLKVRLFGLFEISSGDQPLPRPATLKSQSLLAYLILHRKAPQRREKLCNLFWGDRPETKARGSLSTALWQIHHCLPPGDFILGSNETVQFDPKAAVWMDVDEFAAKGAADTIQSLASAIELYRGEFMSGFHDDWIVDERYRLESLYCSALGRLMALQEAEQRYADALATARRLLDCDPLQEEGHRLAMRAYCNLGQRNAALAQFKSCQAILQQELGVEPMEETRLLYQSILDGRFAAKLARAPVILEVPFQGISAPARSDLPDAPVQSKMVGREQEMKLLDFLWKESMTGRGKIAFMKGEAGVGKSRLVQEFSEEVRWQGFRVLWGRCYEFERLLPYQPFAEAIRAILPTLSVSERSSLPGWILKFVTQFLPENQDTQPEAISAAQLAYEPMQLFSGILQFLSGLSTNGPILLVLEDVHWASESTLQLLHYLVCHLIAHPVLMVCTYRTEADEPGHVIFKMQEQLKQDGIAQSIELCNLTAAQVKALLMEMSGRGEEIGPLANRLYQETEGNPFFLVETIKAFLEKKIIQCEQGTWDVDFAQIAKHKLPFSESLSEAIQVRVRGLDRHVQHALEVAAVLGREFDFDVLEAVLKEGCESALEYVDSLLRHCLIEEGRGLTSRDYVFVHHKIQEVVYDAIPRHRRQHFHAQVARALETLYAARLALIVNEIAYHYEQCHSLEGDWSDKAVCFLVQAGDRARDVAAFQDAADYYERALAILKERQAYEQTARTLIKLGQTRHNALDFERSRQAYDEAFKSWRQARYHSVTHPPKAPHALRLQWREPATLDPALSQNEWSRTVIGQLFSGLTALSGEGDVVPDDAFAWEIRDAGRQYLFYLREEATWSDGSPVTAEDYVYAWRRILTPATNSPVACMLFNIKNAAGFHKGEISDPRLIGIQPVNEKTLRVELEKADGFFLHMLHDFFPIPRQSIHVYGDSWSQPEHIVSNGPFLLEHWTHQQQMALVRNPRYTGRFPGNVERVELCLLTDLLTQYRHYETGQLDILDFWTIPFAERNRARYQHTEQYLSLPQLSTVYLCIDVHQSPCDDIRVRQALAHAIDKNALANVFMQGDIVPATGGFIPHGMPSHSPEIGISFNPDRARLLLAEAGYSKDSKNFFPTLKGCLPSGTLAGLTDLLSQQWREILGIESRWEVGKTAFPGSGDAPPLALTGSGCEYPDPAHFIRWSDFQGESHWQNEKFLALLDEAQQATDFSQRTTLYQQADKILMEELPVIPLAYGRNLMLIKPWVKNYPISPLFYWPWKELIIEPH